MTTHKWTPITTDEIKWLGIDFDDTMCSNSGHPDYTPGPPLPGSIEAIQKLDRQGYKIVVFTARPWVDYKNIEEWCEHYGVPVRRIICGKPLFKYIIDDKNIEFHNDWLEVVAKIIR